MSFWGILFWLWIASYIASFILIKTVRNGMGLKDSEEPGSAPFNHPVYFIFGPLATLYPLGSVWWHRSSSFWYISCRRQLLHTGNG